MAYTLDFTERLREVSDELGDIAEAISETASTSEEWAAVRLMKDAARHVFSAAGALDIDRIRKEQQ